VGQPGIAIFFWHQIVFTGSSVVKCIRDITNLTIMEKITDGLKGQVRYDPCYKYDIPNRL
jgi:hypothetical protein